MPPSYSDPESLARVAGLGLRARRVVEGLVSGQHRSPFQGFNVEFAAYREYAPGDDLRRLDWRVMARTDRHYIKQYEEESNLRATLVVDASASMRYGGAWRKFDHAATLAATLATLLVGQQDQVGLAICDSGQRAFFPPSSTQAQLARCIGALEAAQPERETALGAALSELGGQLPRRGLLVIVSDLLTDLPTFFDGVAQLQYRGHELLVLQVLHPDELELPFQGPVAFHDLEGNEQVCADPAGFRQAYRRAMQDFLKEVSEECGRRRIDRELFLTHEDLGIALSRFLHLRARSQRSQ